MTEKDAIKKRWFLKGQQSIKRKNESGCTCIINDNDEIESLCSLHREHEKQAVLRWLKK